MANMFEVIKNDDQIVETAPLRSPRIYADSPEDYENHLASLAMKEIEDRIRKHTATSQELTTLAKMVSTRERLEKEKLEREIEFLKAKKEALESAKHYEAMVEGALDAMRRYTGVSREEEEYEDYVEE